MGWAAKNNPDAQDRKAGRLKPRPKVRTDAEVRQALKDQQRAADRKRREAKDAKQAAKSAAMNRLTGKKAGSFVMVTEDDVIEGDASKIIVQSGDTVAQIHPTEAEK